MFDYSKKLQILTEVRSVLEGVKAYPKYSKTEHGNDVLTINQPDVVKETDYIQAISALETNPLWGIEDFDYGEEEVTFCYVISTSIGEDKFIPILDNIMRSYVKASEDFDATMMVNTDNTYSIFVKSEDRYTILEYLSNFEYFSGIFEDISSLDETSRANMIDYMTMVKQALVELKYIDEFDNPYTKQIFRILKNNIKCTEGIIDQLNV